MDAVAAGFSATAAAAAIIAFIVGAINGAMFWRARSGLTLGSLISLALYFVITFVIFGVWVLVAMVWGILPLTLAFLTSHLTASYLNASKRLMPIWSTVAAPSGSLVVGVLYMLSFRAGLWVPIVLGLVTNGCLVVLIIRNRGWVTT